MQKSKEYRNTKFDSATIAAAEQHLRSITPEKIKYTGLKVEFGGAEWSFDTLEEFLAAADQGEMHFYANSSDKSNRTLYL